MPRLCYSRYFGHSDARRIDRVHSVQARDSFQKGALNVEKYTCVVITADGAVSVVGSVSKASAQHIASKYPESEGFQTEVCRIESMREQEWWT